MRKSRSPALLVKAVSSADPAQGSRTPQKRAALTRGHILQAASIEFASKGFEGASMRAIARARELELAHLQYHFGDKLALWRGVLAEVMGTFQAELDGLLSAQNRTAADTLARFVECLIRQAATDPVFAPILSHALTATGEAGGVFQDYLRERSRILVTLIRKAQQHGSFVPGDPGVLFYLMLGAALRIFMNSADAKEVTGRSLTDPGFIDEQVRTCMALFLRYPQTKRSAKRVPAEVTSGVLSSDKYNPDTQKSRRGEPSTFYLLTTVESVIRRRVDQELKALGITSGQMMALVVIANDHRLSSARLARLLEVSPQTVNLMVKALERKQLISRPHSQPGRRVRQIEVTRAGHNALESLRAVVEQAETVLLEGVTFEDRHRLREVLARVLKRHRPSALSDWAPLLHRPA
jgi:DNA-binding MarR family transcriptional regulator/AcrR family transcriptional regulator